MEMKQAIADFIHYLSVEKAVNPGTVRNYHAYVNRFSSFLEDLEQFFNINIQVEDISPALIEDFKSFLSQDGLTKKTINYYLIGIRVFLKYCEKKKYKVMNPYDIEKYTRIENKETKLLTDEQLKIFLTSKVNDKSDLLTNLLFGTGMRIFELQQVQVENINHVERKINIFGKGDKLRTIYMTKDSHKMLQEYLKNHQITSGPIFISVHGKPISVRYLQLIINERAKRLLPFGTKVSPHMLRHHFATTLLRKGMKMPTLQKILGHSSIITTMNYLHLSDKETHKEFKEIETIKDF